MKPVAAILASLMLLAACGTSNGQPGATVTVVDGEVAIRADDLRFDASVIEAPADEPFTVVFTNDESVPHNFSVYTSEGGDEIVIGEILTSAGQTDRVEVPALAAGEYFFVCDIHPAEMTGTLVVGEAQESAPATP